MDEQRKESGPRRTPIDQLSQDELRQRLASGELTMEEVDREMQQRARRRAAERDPATLPPEDQVTAGGFGSGQGMGTERTGQGPDRPDAQGYPRTQKDKEDWPH